MPAPDDLTVDDRLVVNTEKDSPDEFDVAAPSQDPAVVPESAVDEFGRLR